ncbi:hypothetical protein CRM22_007694 [Opisthorchis felineus]|uniref:F5/8 type C domain-containing protein n=1 Tax=Opisthorchis felineus TaxID=147828 RepID=A0A4S2LF73_OPIFE|nr:hypothetical protein CRM22_007694 [Opisthorchis felineus]TGZ61912.1 hypothetical protein CRM22_007694 [Opisthorchis felineus]TGZ61914.1 hypothetical protein CRM22_007694 [Opisthorchis felineus]
MLTVYSSRSKCPINSLPYIVLQIMIHITSSAVATTCNSRLLSDRVQVPDTAFEHSSAFNLQHGASAARDDPSDVSLQERAWCPDAVIHTELREFIQIDLGRQSVIKLIITKGRVAQSKGRQTTPYFYLKYQRERTGLWFEYRKENGTQRLNGNQDAMTENYNTMEPSFVARYIRIYPFSLEPTKTCLKLEILGCSANGVIEYQSPKGSLLSDSILPSYAYEARKLTRQMRFQDNSYDFQPTGLHNVLTDFGRPGYSQNIPSSLVLRGGLGKLSDSDIEALTNIGPFLSFKYVGWRRPSQLSRTRRQMRYLPLTSATDSKDHGNRGPEAENVRILFRFDSVYNFTQIRLFVANDFRNGAACPRNITAQISLTGEFSESQPMFIFNPEKDRYNWSSRWINLSLMTVSSGPDVRDLSSIQPSMVTDTKRKSNLEEVYPTATGRFVELKLFFETEWIIVGEVAFDNQQVNEEIWQNKQLPHPAIVSTAVARITTTTTSLSRSNLLVETAFSQGQPTTFTLIVVCGVLALLIVVGLLCLFGLWRQKHLRASFGGRFHRGKKRTNGSTQFDCLNDPQLLASNLSNHNNVSADNQKTAAMLDMQTKFQHPIHCQQDATKPVPNSSAFVPGLQLYSNTIGNNFPINGNLTNPGVGSGIIVNLDPNTPHPFSSSGPRVTSPPVTTSMNSGLAQPSDIIHFLPLSTTQVRCLTSYPTGQLVQNDPYRTFVPDNAIYTTLPESDCDSQPYARIGNGGSIRGLTATTNNQKLTNDLSRFHSNFTDRRQLESGQTNFISGQKDANMLVSSGMVPPPPSLPLPPIPPQHFSPSPSQGSASLMADEFADSGAPLVSSDVKDQDTRWLPQSTMTTGQPLMNRHTFVSPGMNSTDQMLVHQLTNFQTLQGSDYSNTTMGSSSNAYGAYYGATAQFAPTHRTLGPIHNQIQIRR